MIAFVLLLIALVCTVLSILGLTGRYPLLAIAALCLVLVHLLPAMSRGAPW